MKVRGDYLDVGKSLLMRKTFNPQFFVTTRCNSKCKHCNMWKKKPQDIPVKFVREVMKSKHILKNVSISGGEFELHPKICEIVDAIQHEKGLFVNITANTNGVATKKIVDVVQNTAINSVYVSLDTLDPEIYKKMRGVNALEKTIETILQLKEITNNVGITFTITQFNRRKDLRDVLEFGEDNNVGVAVNMYNQRDMFSTKLPFKPYKFDDIIQTKCLEGWKEWRKGKKFPCYSVRSWLEVKWNGEVTFCPNYNRVAGVLGKEPFDKIYKRGYEEARKMINCNDCWISCLRPIDKVIDDNKILKRLMKFM